MRGILAQPDFPGALSAKRLKIKLKKQAPQGLFPKTVGSKNQTRLT